ncbi:hypothetical protein [Longispora fulva]|uniref:Uncharacterized protein n=1 Tax=Longispora fulva TaxID=619741 RepID=A0A8J7KYT7_9ACTN|nr:hypothetical protein [Longispora fulva]MBG6139607.1 hypothetical protein [Longispora fulva]
MHRWIRRGWRFWLPRVDVWCAVHGVRWEHHHPDDTPSGRPPSTVRL